MSTTASRVISGSLASWAQIGVTLLTQLALVPVYLSYWRVEEYGVWLAILAIVNIMSTVDVGHQTYLQYEFLKLGKESRGVLGRYLWAGIVVSVCISTLQVLVILAFISSGALQFLLGELNTDDTTLIQSAGYVLMIQSGVWLSCTSIVGLLSRALAPFGYWPRCAWWGFVYAIVNAVSPLTAVVLGADLFWAGVASAIGAILYGIPVYIDLFTLLRKQRVYFTFPSIPLGYSNFVKSIAISARLLLENLRHQGVRLFISPLAGAAGLAAFSTMRTGANVMLQGLNTIINPIMPDLMRFLHARDHQRSEAAFATIWIVVVSFIGPGIVIIQTFIEPFYMLWTHGKIAFNPILFSLLSLGVLTYAAIQPAIAVVIGNNLIKPQLTISFTAAAVMVGGLFLLIPNVGIVGAGVALLMAEVIAAVIYYRFARRWLKTNSVPWPRKAFIVALTTVCITTISLVFLIWVPEYKWLTVSISMLLFLGNLWRFWRVLPQVASQRARQIFTNLPVIRKMLIKYRSI